MSGKRSIFEEVEAGRPAAGPQAGALSRGRAGSTLAVRIWLIALFALVVLMIAVGGLTRLTDSGLSITEWAPLSGVLPPLSAEDWQAEFARYRQTPEFQIQNSAMTLAQFKSIFWWEWGHRQLGRLIGLVWAVGFVGFWMAGRLPAGWPARLGGLGALGALQGIIGWWMVSSGLESGMLDVASYRLATHLGLAFAILGLIAWYVLRLARGERALLQARRLREGKLARLAVWLAGVAFLQILMGALVAGIDAGRSFVDWPLMAGRILPPDPFSLAPVWRNLFENAALVQFIHRMLGYALVALALYGWWRGRRSAHPATRGAFQAAGAMAIVQMILGIVTLMHAAPVGLALLHQLGAVTLWVLLLRALFLARFPRAQTLRGAA